MEKENYGSDWMKNVLQESLQSAINEVNKLYEEDRIKDQELNELKQFVDEETQDW